MSALSAWFSPVGSGSSPSNALVGFWNASGSKLPPKETFERVRYPGADGVGVYFMGKCGEPFTIQTGCDYATLELARAAIGTYAGLITSHTQVQFYYAGVLWGDVLIHNVTEMETKKVGLIKGGINVNGSAGAILKAEWQLESLFTP